MHQTKPSNQKQEARTYECWNQKRRTSSIITGSILILVFDLLDLRTMLGFERCKSANKGLPLGSVLDHLGSIDGVEASRIEGRV